MAERKEAYSAAHVTIGVDDRIALRAGRRAAPPLAGLAARAPRAPSRRRRSALDRDDDARHARAAGRRPRGAAARRARARSRELPRALAETGFEGRLFVVADEYALQPARRRLRRVLPDAPLLSYLGPRKRQDAGQRRARLGLARRQRRPAARCAGGLRRRRGVRPGRLRRGVLPARHRAGQRADDLAGPGRCRRSAARPASTTPRGKNLIGAFYQPLCVVADTGLLATLSPRAFAAGMAEVAKMAMILDADLFARLEGVAPTSRQQTRRRWRRWSPGRSSSRPRSSSATSANRAIACC